MENIPSKTSEDWFYYKLAMKISADFGATLAIPAVGAAFLGKWLDIKLGTNPWMMALCLVIAFTLTGFIVVRKAQVYGRLYQNGPKK